MTLLSTVAMRVVESFAADIGLRPRVAADHSYGFEFAKSGKLSILSTQDGRRIIISLARPVVRADTSMQMRLLSLTGFDPVRGAMIHAGIAPNGMFVIAFDLENDRFDKPMLGDSLVKLIELHNSIL